MKPIFVERDQLRKERQKQIVVDKPISGLPGNRYSSSGFRKKP
jgi:hypothetical protein